MNELAETVKQPSELLKLNPRQLKNFWAKVDKNGPIHPHNPELGRCWVWTGGKTKKESGYGQFGINGRMKLAHRISWKITYGEIPKSDEYNGTCICHSCDYRPCVNPTHLFPGTQTENMQDMLEKYRGNKSHGESHSKIMLKVAARGMNNAAKLHPERMPRGEANGNSKLTAEKVIQIRSNYSGGNKTLKQIGEEFGISLSMAGRIINRKFWKHV